MHRTCRLTLICALALAGCGGNPHYAPDKAHHTPDGFRNPEPHAPRMGSVLRWVWQRWAAGLPPPPAGGYPVVRQARPELAFLQANRRAASLTWINHSSFLIQLGGMNLVTDPIWSERASPVPLAGPRRHARPGLAIDELPELDAVVISHNHYDHLDEASITRLHARFGETLRFYVPLGLKSWFTARGIDNVTELDWWDAARAGPLTLTLTPARHWSMRSPWDRDRSLWGGWMLAADGVKVFFAGDTGYTPDFATIRARLGAPDWALLPIGAYLPRWFMGAHHLDPNEAVRAHRDLGAGHSVGMHWGSFELSDEPLDAPPRELARARAAAGLPDSAFRVLGHGETVRLRAGN